MFSFDVNDPTFTLDECIQHIKHVVERKPHIWNTYIERKGVPGGQGTPVPPDKQTNSFTGPRSLRMSSIIPEMYLPNKPLRISETEMSGVEAGYVKVLLYDQGCEFGWHCDSETRDPDELALIASKNWVQMGTLILFPPKSIFNYEGGLLEFGCSAFTAHDTFWTYTIIPFGIKHRVSPVTSGKRVVFKTVLYRGPPQSVKKVNETITWRKEEDYEEEYYRDGPVD